MEENKERGYVRMEENKERGYVRMEENKYDAALISVLEPEDVTFLEGRDRLGLVNLAKLLVNRKKPLTENGTASSSSTVLVAAIKRKFSNEDGTLKKSKTSKGNKSRDSDVVEDSVKNKFEGSPKEVPLKKGKTSKVDKGKDSDVVKDSGKNTLKGLPKEVPQKHRMVKIKWYHRESADEEYQPVRNSGTLSIKVYTHTRKKDIIHMCWARFTDSNNCMETSEKDLLTRQCVSIDDDCHILDALIEDGHIPFLLILGTTRLAAIQICWYNRMSGQGLNYELVEEFIVRESFAFSLRAQTVVENLVFPNGICELGNRDSFTILGIYFDGENVSERVLLELAGCSLV